MRFFVEDIEIEIAKTEGYIYRWYDFGGNEHVSVPKASHEHAVRSAALAVRSYLRGSARHLGPLTFAPNAMVIDQFGSLQQHPARLREEILMEDYHLYRQYGEFVSALNRQNAAEAHKR